MIEPPPIHLTTDRLVLRMASPREADVVADYFARNRAHFAPWDPRRPEGFYTARWWRERLQGDAQAALSDRGYRLFVLTHDEPARVVGQTSFANVVRGAFHSCHLGFSIDRALEGRGFMREALTRAIAFAFDDLQLHRIEANHRPENVRSAALLRRLGFVPQGYARDYLRIDGAWRDHVLTALVNHAWSDPEDDR